LSKGSRNYKYHKIESRAVVMCNLITIGVSILPEVIIKFKLIINDFL